MTASTWNRVAVSAAVAAGVTSTVVVGALLSRDRLMGLPGWFAATAVLLVVAVAAASRAGGRRGALREVLGAAAGAAAGVMVFGFCYALWVAVSRTLLRSSILWSDRVGGVLLRDVIAAVVLAALALVLLRPRTGLLLQHGGPWARLLLVASLGNSAGGAVAVGDQLVQHLRVPFVIAATLVSMVLLAVAAAACRVRRSDALVLLAGAILLYGAGLLLEGSLLRPSPWAVAAGIKQLLPSAVVAVLALAAVPALRRRHPSL